MPMKRSGPVGGGGEPRDRDRRGVGADDGLGLERRTERGKDLALDLFLLGRRLDHHVAVAEVGERFRRSDALDGRLALFFSDTLAADLARQIAADGGDALGNALGDDVVEQDLKTRERADMRDAVAHLSGADHADIADGVTLAAAMIAARLRPVLHFDHLRLPSSRALRPLINDRAFRAPGPAPAGPDRGPPPTHSRRPERSGLPHPC